MVVAMNGEIPGIGKERLIFGVMILFAAGNMHQCLEFEPRPFVR